MNKNDYSSTVYIADYTNYCSNQSNPPIQFKGVVITEQSPDLIASFELRNNNHIAFEAVNIEENSELLKRSDGTQASQCECFFTDIRKDGGKPWMLFLEMKYCLPKNLRKNVRKALTQLEKTYSFLCEEKAYFAHKSVKPYFVIATPDGEDLAPFDDYYLDQDEMLSIKENYDGAQVYHSNVVEVMTAEYLRVPR